MRAASVDAPGFGRTAPLGRERGDAVEIVQRQRVALGVDRWRAGEQGRVLERLHGAVDHAPGVVVELARSLVGVAVALVAGGAGAIRGLRLIGDHHGVIGGGLEAEVEIEIGRALDLIVDFHGEDVLAGE